MIVEDLKEKFNILKLESLYYTNPDLFPYINLSACYHYLDVHKKLLAKVTFLFNLEIKSYEMVILTFQA